MLPRDTGFRPGKEPLLVMSHPRAVGNGPAGSILTVDGLRKTYRQGFLGRRGAPAVADVSLEVRRGEIFALLGHNGAGKTTTLKAILGLVRPDRGRITIDGVDAARPESRESVGYLPEAPYFHENLAARELLDFYGKLLGLSREQRRERTAECLAQVGMAHEARRKLRDCSKGMRQRIGLAQALLNRPRLLILDEPQSGLDPLGRRQVRDLLLAEKRRGATIVFSSHIVPDVEAIADRVAMLRHGRLAEIKDLSSRPPSRCFRIVAAPPRTAEQPSSRWLEDPRWTVTETTSDRWILDVVGAGNLGALLAELDQASAAVHDVRARGGDLETEFLAGLERDHAQEVPSC
ncbi:ATP-binding cassette domain-containing protein [bacterium]|nr:ATP-binding cassette domain-containing protein [bacterium]